MKRTTVLLAAWAASAMVVSAKASGGPDAMAGLAEASAPSIVRVEYTLQYSEGEAPSSKAWAERCPNCGQVHSDSLTRYVTEERPLEAAGFLLSPTEILTRDAQLEPRFIRRVTVTQGNESVEAEIEPVFHVSGQPAVRLKLKQPLSGARPLEFRESAKPPFFAVTPGRLGGLRKQLVTPLGGAVMLLPGGERRQAVPPFSVIVDAKGRAAGIAMRDFLPADGSWKGSPLKWPGVTDGEMKKRLATVAASAGGALLPATLKFRSPKQQAGRDFRSSGADAETERTSRAVLVSATRILILTDLWPNKIGRAHV